MKCELFLTLLILSKYKNVINILSAISEYNDTFLKYIKDEKLTSNHSSSLDHL